MAGMRFRAKRVCISRGSAGELLVTARPHSDNGDDNGNGNGDGNGNGGDCEVDVYSPGEDADLDKLGLSIGHYPRVPPRDDDPPYFVGCTGGADGKGTDCILRHFEPTKDGGIIYYCDPI
jgi:hypothetical protein